MDQPQLDIVEGLNLASTEAEPVAPERAIVPDAFEQVLARVEADQGPVYVPVQEPVYKSRPLIAALFLMGGLALGRFTMEPQTITKVVEKIVPAAAMAKPEVPLLAVSNPFRKLASTAEFDPWMPLNGGFPIPPPQTQGKLLERPSGGFNPEDYNLPSPMRGNVGGMIPFDPGAPLKPGPGLPDANGTGITPGVDPNQGLPDPNGKKPSAGDNPGSKFASEKYVAMSLSGPEPSSGQSRILGIASANGGTGRSFTHMTEEGSVEAQGVLIIVPVSAADKVQKAIEGLGGASVDATNNGNAGAFQGSISGLFNARLKKLRDKKEELLKDFEEAAQPVKQIIEAIDMESRAVSATRLPGGLSGKAVFRILLK
ncbi:MAG: hypothetical protein WCK51_05140 [Armatimonadota bacterium]